MKRTFDDALRALASRLYGHFDCATDIIAFHEHRFLYYALPKVANSSIKLTLGRLIPEVAVALDTWNLDAIATPFSDRTLRADLRRKRVLLCKHQVKPYADYASFAFVRNPWDRLVSCYTQKIADRDFSEGPQTRATARVLDAAGFFKPDLTFTEFARAVAAIPDADANRHFRSQHVFLTDRSGTLLVERIARFENLAEEFARLMDLVGLPQVRLPHLKKTARRDYREYYDDETAAVTAERYRRDIELFGYKFG